MSDNIPNTEYITITSNGIFVGGRPATKYRGTQLCRHRHKNEISVAEQIFQPLSYIPTPRRYIATPKRKSGPCIGGYKFVHAGWATNRITKRIYNNYCKLRPIKKVKNG